ncbi:hypothetical protein CANINC_001841 [Pichia inconspicua]|uniref:RRM domain-containing protein n=1 Tax=Pichia inconspicua TaxID=52247 RepID=A0A4T0X2N3_9ASCO|nr:hypothetical protein CANINC_001841 [[Candida] inconspicua]
MHPRLNLNKSHRFLPQNLVLGSPFYNSTGTFNSPLTPTIVNEFNTPNILKFINLNNDSSSQLLQLINGSIETTYFENNDFFILFTYPIDGLNNYNYFSNQLPSLRKSLNSPNLSIEKIESPDNTDATDSLLITDLPSNIKESVLFNNLSKFGTINTFKFNHNNVIVTFNSVKDAINCKNNLIKEENLSNINVQFFSQNYQIYLPIPNFENRSIYIGNLDKNTSIEDICNVIRGGPLEEIKLLRNKRIAFITFLYHSSATDLLARSMIEPLFINSKPVKLSWANNCNPLDPMISFACSNLNASRNLYIGLNEELETIDDYDLIPLTDLEIQKLQKKLILKPEDKFNRLKSSFDSTKFKKVYKCLPDEIELRKDFSIFGEIEQINYFNNNICAFINFTSIKNCINTVEQFNNPKLSKFTHNAFDGKYEKFKIFYGKDRCANPPKKKRSNHERSDWFGRSGRGERSNNNRSNHERSDWFGRREGGERSIHEHINEQREGGERSIHEHINEQREGGERSIHEHINEQIQRNEQRHKSQQQESEPKGKKGGEHNGHIEHQHESEPKGKEKKQQNGHIEQQQESEQLKDQPNHYTPNGSPKPPQLPPSPPSSPSPVIGIGITSP